MTIVHPFIPTKKRIFTCLFLLFSYYSQAQTCYLSTPPLDKGPGSILVASNNMIQSVNLITGMMTPITSAPGFYVINNLAINPVSNMIYYADNSGGTRSIQYYNIATKTHGLLTNGLIGVSPGPGSPDISTSGACMTSDGKLFIANHNVTPTRLYKLNLNNAGNAVVGATDYIRFPSNKLFGDFVIKNNQLLCQFVDGTFQVWNLPPFSSNAPTPPSLSFMQDIYCQMATGWDGTVYRIGTTSGIIDKYISTAAGAAIYTGVTLPPPGGISSAYKDAAGPVPATAMINGNLNCVGGYSVPGIKVNLYYDVKQDGIFDSLADKLVYSCITDANGVYKFPNLIPDFYIVDVPIQPGINNELIFSTKNNYPGTFLNIGDTCVINIHSDSLLAGFCSPLPLPINLSGTMEQNQVKLNWTSGTVRSNIEFFEVERSTDGKSWETAEHSDSYKHQNLKGDYFEDQDPLCGLNYYRIKQVEFNGNITFSNILSFNLRGMAEIINIYQGPEKNSINFHLPKALSMNAFCQIFTLNGQKVFSKIIVAGSQVLTIKIPGIKPGIYGITLINDQLNFGKTIFVR